MRLWKFARSSNLRKNARPIPDRIKFQQNVPRPVPVTRGDKKLRLARYTDHGMHETETTTRGEENRRIHASWRDGEGMREAVEFSTWSCTGWNGSRCTAMQCESARSVLRRNKRRNRPWDARTARNPSSRVWPPPPPPSALSQTKGFVGRKVKIITFFYPNPILALVLAPSHETPIVAFEWTPS